MRMMKMRMTKERYLLIWQYEFCLFTAIWFQLSLVLTGLGVKAALHIDTQCMQALTSDNQTLNVWFAAGPVKSLLFYFNGKSKIYPHNKNHNSGSSTYSFKNYLRWCVSVWLLTFYFQLSRLSKCTICG